MKGSTISVEAASLKVCFKDIPLDAAEVRLYVGTSNAAPLLPGQTQTDGSICATLSPLPAPVVRGITQQYTVRAANAVGEESAPSNALPFRFPTIPLAPTLLSVGVQVP